ncbi:MAG TPA: glutathione S-transferase N-terminal domain-containing protein [Stellaceae bacterium]
MFEHCSLCLRVRMTAAPKGTHLQETVVLDDDTDTMAGLVGKRVIPILVKDDGKPMLESMDMVRTIDGRGEPVLAGQERREIAAWADEFAARTAPLAWPRYPLDDVRVLPLLRSVAVVKGLRLPRKVRDHFEAMMSRIGYQPLPVSDGASHG